MDSGCYTYNPLCAPVLSWLLAACRLVLVEQAVALYGLLVHSLASIPREAFIVMYSVSWMTMIFHFLVTFIMLYNPLSIPK